MYVLGARIYKKTEERISVYDAGTLETDVNVAIAGEQLVVSGRGKSHEVLLPTLAGEGGS